MIDENEILPRDVVMDEAGHLTEEGATLLADGEERWLPADVRTHADACDECVRRVGEAALLSTSIGAVLRDERAVRTQEHAAATVHAAFAAAGVGPRAATSEPVGARSFPWAAVSAALVLAAVGLVPSLVRSNRTDGALRTLAVLTKAAVTYARSGGLGASPLGATIACASACVLVVMALLVVRRLPHVAMIERGA